MNFKRFGLGKQLINPSVATYGKYIDANGIEQTSTSGLVNHTDYISVTANRLYTVSYDKPPVSGNTIAISWYDSNKNFILRDSEIMPFESGRYKFTKTAPNNSAFAIVNFTYFSGYSNTQNTNNYIFAIGESQLPYEPYGNTWTDIPHYIMGTSTDTLTTLPAVLYPNAVTATVGLKGNMSQTGSPTPQNPIQPSETGERTAQLYFKRIANASLDGTGSVISNASFDCYVAQVEANKQYIGTGFVYAFFTNNPSIGNTSYNGQRVVASVVNGFTSPIDGYVAVRHDTGVTNAMLNLGETALPYEPYGVKIPILNNAVTTNVYLGEVQTTRNIKKFVLTGGEAWSMSVFGGHNGFLAYAPQTQIGTINCICSHYKVDYANTNNTMYFIAQPANGRFIIFDDRFSSSDDFKTYLQQQYANGTPVCVWYVLATPKTAVVNEPIRKIGDYADTVSGITIPTIAGANTLSIDTTLQPSEVTVNYKGWHPVADVHERDNGAWT